MARRSLDQDRGPRRPPLPPANRRTRKHDMPAHLIQDCPTFLRPAQGHEDDRNLSSTRAVGITRCGSRRTDACYTSGPSVWVRLDFQAIRDRLAIDAVFLAWKAKPFRAKLGCGILPFRDGQPISWLQLRDNPINCVFSFCAGSQAINLC